MCYRNSPAACKPSEVTTPSTGYHPGEYWRIHGTSWRSVFDLHVAIVNRLQAISSSWCSSSTDWKAGAQEAWRGPSWREAAEQYPRDRAGRPLIIEIDPNRLKPLRRLMQHEVSIEQAWNALNDPRNRPTPSVVVEAIMLAVRERGLATLKEPATVERLERCDAAARAEINQLIEKLGLKHAS